MNVQEANSGEALTGRALPLLFLAASLATSIALALVTPPFQAPDERAHFFRAYQLATLTGPTPTGAVLPRNVVDSAARLEDGIPFHPEKGISTADVRRELALTERGPTGTAFFPGALLYTPVPYVPQVAGIAAARLMTERPLLMFYAARLSNAICCSLLLFFAIRRAAASRLSIALLSLAPMATFLRGSCSADAMTFALAVALIATVTTVLRGDEREGHWVLFFIVAFLLSLCKPVYFLLPLLVLARKRSDPVRHERVRDTATVLIVLAGTAVSFATARDHMISFRPNTSASAQFAVISHAPLRFAELLANDFVRHAPRYAAQLIGKLGWLDVELPAWFIFTFAILLAVSLTADGGRVRPAIRIVSLAIFVVTATLIAASQYLIWTPIGANEILGIQGRYFLPTVPFLFLALTPPLRRLSESVRIVLLCSGAAAAATIAIIGVANRYYQ